MSIFKEKTSRFALNFSREGKALKIVKNAFNEVNHAILRVFDKSAASSSVKKDVDDREALTKPVYKQLEVPELRAVSKRLMADPLTVFTVEETKKFLVDLPSSDRSPFLHLKYKLWDRNQEFKATSKKFLHLIMERLENKKLTSVFQIDQNFNMKAYFCFIHVWLLHQRLVTEGFAGESIDNMLFDLSWDLVKDWLLLKNVAEYRFEAELRNVQGFMLGLCVKLDEALEDPELMPARIREVLFRNVYEEVGDHPEEYFIELLTKYVIRQLTHIMQIRRDNFLFGYFSWADFPYSAAQRLRPKVIPPLAYRIRYGGYLPNGRIPLKMKGNLLPEIVTAPIGVESSGEKRRKNPPKITSQ